MEQKDVPGYREYAGVLQAYVSADMRARVEGFLLEQRYVEDAQVKKGQLLFVIDPKTFEAAKLQAEGTLAQARAELEKSKETPTAAPTATTIRNVRPRVNLLFGVPIRCCSTVRRVIAIA